MQLKIYAHLETNNDPLLLLFVKFNSSATTFRVSLSFKVGDLDINDKKIC
jgi:hypothetical protein